jgi:hypothetical protein
MPGFAFQKGPDGKYVSTYDGPVYQGNAPLGTTGAAPAAPVTGARRMEDDGRLVQRALTNVVPILGAQVPMVAGGIKGIQTLMQTGDPTKAWNAGAAETAAILKPISGMPEGPGMLWARTHYNASRNLTQSVLGNLPASGSRKPGQADSPMLGFIPPLPKVKSSGGIEDFATGLVQTGMGVAASALALRAGGALLTPLVAAAPGGTAVLQGLGAASRLPATLRTAATAVQGIGGPSGALNTAANIARVGQIATEGAAIGALTNYAAFTPEEKTQADEWLGWAKGSNWLPLQEYIFSKPGDTEADARWKNAVFNLPIDATMNLGIHALGIAAKAAISRIPRSALGRAGQPAPQRPQPGVPAGQQTVDVTAQPVKEPAPTAEAPPAVVTPADVNKAVDNAATKLAHISTTVHPEMGPVTPENRGAWLPSFNQVREMPVSEIATDPKRLQSKAAGQATETGVTGSLEGVDVYNPLMGKPISVWQDPTDGKMYVVNGHNQLDLAKRSGIDNVLTWQIEAATAEEARAIGALENMGQGSGTAIDAAKVIREMGYSPEEIKARGIDLQGQVTRDAIALSRLPQATFNKVVAGKLDLDKAIALGSKEPTPAAPVVQAAPAAPAAPKPAELPDTRGQNQYFHGSSTPIKELKAESDVPGVTPKSGTFEIIYQTATTKGKNIYGQGFYVTDDLTTASSYQKKGTGTTPVVYQIKEKNPNLRFYDLDQQIGQDAVDDLFAKTPGMAKEQVYNAVDDALSGEQYQSLGQALDLIRNASGAFKSQDVFDSIKEYLTSQGYGGFTHVGGNLAGRGKRQHQVRIYWDPAASITLEKYQPATTAAEVPAAPTGNVTVIPLEETSPTTVVPPVAAPDIQIPPDASRPLPPDSPRVDTVSQSISRWLGIGQEEARNLLLAKGEVLDVTKIPGMNLEKALDDQAMGMTSPETQAITRAYQRFYGPTSRQQQNELFAIANAVDRYMPDELPDKFKVSPEVTAAAKALIIDTVRKIAGDDIAITFENGRKFAVDTGAHGNPGELIEIGGGYGFNEQGIMYGDPIKEVMDFVRMGFKDYPKQTETEYLINKLMTGAHESMHALQLRYLSSKQLKVTNTVFAKLKLALAQRVRGQGAKPIENVAKAYQDYYLAVKTGESPAAAILGIDPELQAMLREDAAGEAGMLKFISQLGEGVIETVKIIDNLTDFVEKLWNAFRGRGWTSIRDIFAQAAAGDIKAAGVHRGHAFEINDLPGRVTDYMNAKNGDSEWARRIIELKKQGIPQEWLDLLVEDSQYIKKAGGSLYSKVPEESGPARPSLPNGPENPSWATDFARLLDQYQNQLASGEITMEELYVLNRTQKTESPSGSQIYTADSQELIPGYAAMGQLLGDRPTFTGYPVRNPEETVKNNQAWFDTRQINGFNGGQVLAGLDAITKGFRAHEHGALNRAMAYADFLQKEAQIQAAQWLNSVNSGTSNKSERLATLITAVDKARRMHLAIANVTRPWGQMGLEMQLPRNYEIPTNVVEEAAPTTSIVDQAIMEELAKGDANPNGAFENITDVLDPELTHAAKGGEITVQAEAAADALADFVNSGGVDPAIRTQTWQDLESINNAKPGVAARTGPSGENPLQMLRVNNLISAGITAGTNLTNALFNIGRLSAAQGVGAVVSGDMDRVMYSVFMLNTFLQNIDNAFRLGTHAIESGKPLFNTTSGVLEHYSSMAAKDAQEALATANPNARTGWSLTTADMTEQFSKTAAGQVINAVWGTLGTGASRIAIGLDTFSSTLSGHTFEHFNHMPRGMQLAVENGLQKYSPEAFEYASNYAKARVKETLRSVVIDGKNIADAVMTGPDAQKFMDAVNFTDNLHVDIEPRTLTEGMRLGQARGLKDGELTQWAQRYVDEGNLKHKIAEFGHATLGRVGNIPGDLINGLSNAPGFVGPVFKFIQPFQRVPINILKSVGRSTPGLNLFVDSFYRDIMSENPAVRERVRGEFLLGGGVLTAAIVATTHGRIRLNGSGPSDPIANENWLKERKMANSIQFWDDSTNTWGPAISTAAFEPYTTLFSAIGDYNDLAAGLPMETRMRLGASMALDVFRMQSLGMLKKTYFQGLNELYEAAFDPNKAITGPSSRNRGLRLIERLVASMVPWSSASRAARRQVDPIPRSVDASQTGNFAMDFFQETMDEIRNQSPGLSDGLAGRRDWSAPGAPYMTVPQILGSEVVRDNPFLLGSMQFTPLSIMRVSDGPSDPVQAEMSRLHGKGTAFSGPRAADFGPEMRLTSSELSEYQRIFGTVKDVEGFTWHERVSKMVNSADYMALPVELPSTVDVPERAARIQIWTDKFKKLAKDEYMRTTSKGAAIAAEEQRKAIRQAETLYGRKYGVSESQAPSSTQTFIQELTR